MSDMNEQREVWWVGRDWHLESFESHSPCDSSQKNMRIIDKRKEIGKVSSTRRRKYEARSKLQIFGFRRWKTREEK